MTNESSNRRDSDDGSYRDHIRWMIFTVHDAQ